MWKTSRFKVLLLSYYDRPKGSTKTNQCKKKGKICRSWSRNNSDTDRYLGQIQYITGQICSVSTAPVRFSGKGWGSGLYQRKEKTLCSWGDFVKLVTVSFSGFFLYWAVGIFPVGISRPLLGEVSVLSVFFEGPNIWTGICLCVTTPPWKPRFFSRVLDGLTVLTGLVLNNRADLSSYVLKL